MNQIRAILLCGGTGSRMATSLPKQFLELKGKPLLVHSVERFKKWGLLKSITIVSHPDWILKTEEVLSEYLDGEDQIVEGGASRHLSTIAGLQSFSYDDSDLIFIHDVARPNFHLEDLDQLVEKTRIFGAATLVANMTESLVVAKQHSGFTEQSLTREEVYSVKTPQMAAGFLLKEKLLETLPKDSNKHPTDLCSWIHPSRVGIVVTDHTNVKVTNPGDIELAENLFINE